MVNIIFEPFEFEIKEKRIRSKKVNDIELTSLSEQENKMAI